jgi:YidC/Oxa1 family membrane protein insertase
VHNWALAIVLLTCLVKLLTIPLSHKSMKSMKVMQEQMARLKPEVDEINRKFGDDRTKVNQEMMALYQRHGINPFAQMAGCLPIFIQMPIYIALYSMLGSAVELYRVPFLWIADMTTADPYYVMPLLMGGLMYWQTKLTPNSGDPQQKMMATMMPIMFTGFSIFMPAGLTLYMITNTILGMIQQWVVNRGKTPVKPAVATAAVVANPPAGTPLKSGKPGRPKPGRG